MYVTRLSLGSGRRAGAKLRWCSRVINQPMAAGKT
ncbi:hypothetical protein ACO22_03564 [Paracoccidioides brasiliensis]|uniref:Uncharacterized protein n=1 Tax=Paracoccidioides brasiliensis TaxID=121759 RepID=A0A1D2JFL4_PARBR|nr:hypothetical protein ACO22_03564 [Paracoccidioides brasiliensis]